MELHCLGKKMMGHQIQLHRENSSWGHENCISKEELASKSRVQLSRLTRLKGRFETSVAKSSSQSWMKRWSAAKGNMRQAQDLPGKTVKTCK